MASSSIGWERLIRLSMSLRMNMQSTIRNATIVIIFFITLCCLVSEAAAERMAVVTDYANIRTGPGTNHEIIWKIEKYHPIEILEKKENWYHFKDFEGDEGWIYAPLVGKINTVITQSDRCNIRSGPGTNYSIQFTVERGVPFRLISKKGKWLQIRHADGDQGWIHRSLIW